MNDQLWWIAAVKRPTEEEAKKEGKRLEILMQPEVIPARDEKEASFIAARRIPDDIPSDRVEVVVVPFAPCRC